MIIARNSPLRPGARWWSSAVFRTLSDGCAFGSFAGCGATEVAAPRPATCSPVYGWLTEGFAAPDLKGAKALLDELQ